MAARRPYHHSFAINLMGDGLMLDPPEEELSDARPARHGNHRACLGAVTALGWFASHWSEQR
jgi:hypothetical protein